MKKTWILCMFIATLIIFLAACNDNESAYPTYIQKPFEGTEINGTEYDAYLAVINILENDIKEYLSSKTNYQYLRITEFECKYIEPMPDVVTVNPALNAPHRLLYNCLIEESGKFGLMSFSFVVSKYVDNFVDLKAEIDKGIANKPKSNYLMESPKYIEDNKIFSTIAPYIADDVAPYIQNNPDLNVFHSSKIPNIVFSYSKEQTMNGNGDVTALFIQIYYPDTEMAFILSGYYVPQGVYYNQSKVLDLFWARRTSKLTENHIKFQLASKD